MPQSMTAYFQSNIDTPFGNISCELRSVNHKYLDFSPKMPEIFRVFESQIKEKITDCFSRGRIDCYLRFKENSAVKTQVNNEELTNLNQLVNHINNALPNLNQCHALDILKWPNILHAEPIAADAMKESVFTLIQYTIEGLLSVRKQEGKKVAEVIAKRNQQCQIIIKQVQSIFPEIAERHEQALHNKLQSILTEYDKNRVEQELILFLQKYDIAEEIDRLQIHLEEVGILLNQKKPIGRRLDFLMQELNREANTLGSKAQDIRITKASVDLKVLIEQMREQIQNLS